MTDDELRAAYMAGAPGALAWPWPEGLRAVLALGRQAAGEPVYIRADDMAKARTAPHLCRIEPEPREGGFVALYIAPPSAARVPLTPDRDKLHRAFRDLGYTTNGQTSDLLDLVFKEFEAVSREGGAV